VVFVVWCIIAPSFLLSHLSPLRPQYNAPSNPPPPQIVIPQEPHHPHSDEVPPLPPSNQPSPMTHSPSDRLWTFEREPHLAQGLTWYEKGQILMEKNKDYLAEGGLQASSSDSSITLVSGLFDLGRGQLGDSFSRSFEHYVERFKRFMQYRFPKIIFVQPEHMHLYEPLIESSPGPVHVIPTSIDVIKNFPWLEQITRIREDPEWRGDPNGWLAESPQARLELYNAMVMSKLFWTRNAAQLNPFNTESFLWIDGGHLCNDPQAIGPDNSDVFRTHFDKLLITYFDYEPTLEVHGFERKAFLDYLDYRGRYVLVGRGGIFGGSRAFLEVGAEIYQLALDATLNAGYMGTEENIFSILLYRYPELVHEYRNGDGGNCAIFYEAVHGPQPAPKPLPSFSLVEGGLDLRGATCERLPADAEDEFACFTDGVRCPSFVTPLYLHLADGQYSCQSKHQLDMYCTAQCSRHSTELQWFAHSCPFYDICPPYGTVAWQEFYESDPFNPSPSPTPTPASNPVPLIEEIPLVDIETYDPPLMPPRPEVFPPWEEQSYTKAEREFMKEVKAQYNSEERQYLQKYGYDLRGLQCEILDGRETCFSTYRNGRDLCPSFVTAAYLSMAPQQYACSAHVEDTYCTAMCQEGVDRVAWHAHNVEWCAENVEDCAPRPPVIPYDDFAEKMWTQPPPALSPCVGYSEEYIQGLMQQVGPLSVGILTRGGETETLDLSLSTWVGEGLLPFVDEVLIMVNEMTPEMEKHLEPYTKPPINLRILSSPKNEGILRGINWLMGNATHENFLFLEKDFRLVEPLPCVIEQILTGQQLIQQQQAHVVKYRSRYNPGRPNWAEVSYKGKEELVFKRQPNLLCNFYHFVDFPAQRWPQHFRVCNEEPLFFCVDSEFCNWTNNPFMVRTSWWFENFVTQFDEVREAEPSFNLEGFMNWHPGAWNDRHFIVAEGDGLFKHCDANNFGQ